MNKKILIIGLGLIGGSYAEALTNKGYEVYAITRSQESIDFALEKGIIKGGTTELDKDFISSFKFVVFSLYPTVFIDWIKKNKDLLNDSALITDVSGVKESVIYEIKEELEDTNIEYVSHHPMAGREVYGVKNATKEIFKGANFIVTPFEDSSDEAIETIKELGEELGFKRISVLDPKTHDEMIAYLSQLTHAIAVGLMCGNDNTHLKDYTGDSFRDLTRIASINEDMWSELFLMNKEALLKEMDMFNQAMKELRDAVESDNKEKLKEMMRTSTLRRSYFKKD